MGFIDVNLSGLTLGSPFPVTLSGPHHHSTSWFTYFQQQQVKKKHKMDSILFIMQNNSLVPPLNLSIQALLCVPSFIFFNVYLFILKETEKERECTVEGQRERERERERDNPKQALHCQHRAQWRAQSHQPRDHDLNRNQVGHLNGWAAQVPPSHLLKSKCPYKVFS